MGQAAGPDRLLVYYSPNESLQRLLYESLLALSHESLSKLKPTRQETAEIHKKNKKQLEIKCKSAVTLKNCGDNLIMFFRNCLESPDLGKLIMGIQGCTGLRMVEAVCRGQIEAPKLTHNTDDIYWGWVTGICKKKGEFPGHERCFLHRREIIHAAIERLRKNHFAHLQHFENTQVSRKCCKKINRAINKSWPYPEIKSVTSHFFRSFFVAATFHYFNQSSSLSQWCCDVLAHESLDASFPYTGLLVTGFGSLTFDTERQLQGLARLSLT